MQTSAGMGARGAPSQEDYFCGALRNNSDGQCCPSGASLHGVHRCCLLVLYTFFCVVSDRSRLQARQTDPTFSGFLLFVVFSTPHRNAIEPCRFLSLSMVVDGTISDTRTPHIRRR